MSVVARTQPPATPDLLSTQQLVTSSTPASTLLSSTLKIETQLPNPITSTREHIKTPSSRPSTPDLSKDDLSQASNTWNPSIFNWTIDQEATMVSQNLAALNNQLHVGQQLSCALQELVLLKEDLKTIHLVHDIQSSRYQHVPEMGNSRPSMPLETRKRLQESNELHQMLNTEYSKAVDLAKNALNYWKRAPTADMQKRSLDCTQQLHSVLINLRGSTAHSNNTLNSNNTLITDNQQTPIQRYLQLAKKTCEFTGDHTIAQITTQKLHSLQKAEGSIHGEL